MSYEKYECKHKLVTSDTDFKQELKPSAILNFFQETAGINSSLLGVGYPDLRPRGLFWVLSKIYGVLRRYGADCDLAALAE